jgi:hypothetical protein
VLQKYANMPFMQRSHPYFWNLSFRPEVSSFYSHIRISFYSIYPHSDLSYKLVNLANYLLDVTPVNSTFASRIKINLFIKQKLLFYEQFTDYLYWTETPDERFRFVPGHVPLRTFIPEFIPAA